MAPEREKSGSDSGGRMIVRCAIKIREEITQKTLLGCVHTPVPEAAIIHASYDAFKRADSICLTTYTQLVDAI